MKRIKVYAGYYELYITDKELKEPFILVEEFDTMAEAEDYVVNRGDWLMVDEDLVEESEDIYPDEHIFNAKDYM